MSENLKSSLSAFSWIERLIKFCLEKKIVVVLAILMAVVGGLIVAPFDWNLRGIPRDTVPVDAIPDIGENQQIVFTEWSGRSPQDVENQISYPLTAALMGIPKVKTVRSLSEFGFSTIYVIFKDKVDFYWARSRILEKLNSLPAGILPEGVQPGLGPDSTALGQIFWYTLEGRDKKGNPAGGWDLHELRTIQDWYVRFALLSADGVSEVASVGGFVQEYQIDADPNLMRAYNVKLEEVVAAVKGANIDVGARTIEVNRVEYVIRGIGFVKSPKDLETAVIKVEGGVPIFVHNVANVTLGPAMRRGALDREGTEAAGGVVVVRYGENPLTVIKNVKKKIEEISPGLPRKTLSDGTVSQIRIVPFYDRTGLIYETLGTLQSALSNEILIAVIVIIIMMGHFGSSFLISGILPLAVLMCFLAMKFFQVDANIVALSGIAIAIGTMVDMGIIIAENIYRHIAAAQPNEDRLQVVFRASKEVGGAVLTAVSTTIVSFLPVFTMVGPEGKLFKPLAFTKTFALFFSIVLALAVIPPFAHIMFGGKMNGGKRLRIFYEALIYLGGLLTFVVNWWIGLLIAFIGAYKLFLMWIPVSLKKWLQSLNTTLIAIGLILLLSHQWLPLGPEKGLIRNLIFVAAIIGSLLIFYRLFQNFYAHILGWCLNHKAAFLSMPCIMVLLGGMVWLGFDALFGWLPNSIKKTGTVSYAALKFPGLSKEFMPPFDEGSYLFMPTTMPHASIGEVLDILQKQDMVIKTIPEVESVIGKLGRAESPLDPASIAMIETVIKYKAKYLMDHNGRPLRFRFFPDEMDLSRSENGTILLGPDGKPYLVRGRFARDKANQLIPDPHGNPFRLWRAALNPALNPGRKGWGGIQKPDDIWDAIIKAAQMIPGTTSAPRLQPISARIVMLQSGIRASMGVKVKGPDLETIQKVAFQIEEYLREVPSIDPLTVIADRVVGKPYLEVHIDRRAIARYGISVQQVQDVIEFAIGGKQVTTTVEGRERYPVRVRYMRELRDDIESLGKVLVPAPDGIQVPLIQLSEIRYAVGPQDIKAEDTFLVGYVLFDKKIGYSEVDVVNRAGAYLHEKMEKGEFLLPAGASFAFTGTYENQVRSEKTLMIILPLALSIIFLILYLHFNSAATAALVFSGIPVAWSGGLILIWLYSQSWFLDFAVFGTSMRELFQVHPINLSVAIWVGFLALFGIASDDGVVMATYLDGIFLKRPVTTVQEIRQTTIEGGKLRVRPCLMTTATTVIALLPVLTSTGRGSEIMVPMALPSFGGMLLEVSTMLIVPVLYCAIKEFKLKTGIKGDH